MTGRRGASGSPARHRARRGVLAALLLLGAGRLAAQIPLDSLPLADSLQRDTINTTERYLREQAALLVRLPTAPLVGLTGPGPALTRVVLSRDSMDWALAETVSDLLQRVPGVYLWRGGWVGRTEYPNFRGRGPTSVEYLLDGLPYTPIGPDSIGVDPSLFSLSLLDRVEIERWPGLLRVHLFSHRHDRKSPYSKIGISAGDKSIARYIGVLERRTSSGIGFALATERMVVSSTTGTSSAFDNTSVWLQLGYVPSARVGVQAQLWQGSPDRKPYIQITDTLDLRLTGSRKDMQLRAFVRSRDDDLGLRADLLVGRTSWSGSGVSRAWQQIALITEWRTPTFGLSAQAIGRSEISPADLRATAAWTPFEGVSASAEVGSLTFNGGRTSRWLGARAGLRLPLALQVTGSLRTGRFVAAPAIMSDSAQRLTDWEGTVGWQRSWAGFEVGYARSDAFRPLAYRPYLPSVAGLGLSPRTDWLTVGWRLAPRQWLTLEGWYSDPVSQVSPDGVPPTHSITQATIRSKFWRSFPSGIFDFKAQVSYESWGDGVIGRDPAGAAIPLDGASFWRTMIELRLDSFMLYWDRYNLQASRKSYVPGFRILNFGSTFGVRWEFAN